MAEECHYTTTRENRELRQAYPSGLERLYYTTTRENRELRHAKDIPDRTEDYTTTRENWELRLMLLNLTRIVESVLASSEDSVEQELRRLELEFEKLQMDWQNTAPKWEAKTLPPRGRPEVFIDLNQIVCVVNTCGYVRQSEM